MMPSDQALDWIQSASTEEFDQALASGDLDALLYPNGPGLMSDEQAAFADRVSRLVPKLDLSQWHCAWSRTADGRLSLSVDGGRVVFVDAGETLHMVGPTPDGKVRVYVITPDGRMTLGAARPDPTSPAIAERN